MVALPILALLSFIWFRELESMRFVRALALGRSAVCCRSATVHRATLTVWHCGVRRWLCSIAVGLKKGFVVEKRPADKTRPSYRKGVRSACMTRG
jgi:hypothetical protein